LKARQTRWMEFLSEYDFDIKHIKGKENEVVDALNKRIHLIHAKTISMHYSYLKRRISDVAITNQHYLHVKESLQRDNV
jgi:hypothetical protein